MRTPAEERAYQEWANGHFNNILTPVAHAPVATCPWLGEPEGNAPWSGTSCCGGTQVTLYQCKHEEIERCVLQTRSDEEAAAANQFSIATCAKCKHNPNNIDVSKAIVVDVDRHGYGDAMVYAWIAEGAKAADQQVVIKATGQRAHLMQIFRQTVVSQAPAERIRDHTHTYQFEISQKGKASRAPLRARAIGLDGITPVRPKFAGSEAARAWIEREGLQNVAYLFPSASFGSRVWPVNYWLDLADHLAAMGLTPVFNTEVNQGAWSASGYQYYVSLAWEYICELMLASRICIGADSGPAHVAGTLDVPMLAIVGPTPHGGGFECYDSVEFISVDRSELPCVGCYWQPPFRRACDFGCAALQMLTPQRVVKRVRELA